MSIAVWKTILAFAKLAAVVLILGSGFFFWRHHELMQSAWAVPNFSPDVIVATREIADTKDLGLMLGRFQRERPKEAPVKEAPKEPDITGALAEYGEITDAIVVYPPYEEGGFVPAIIFRWKPGKKPANQEGDARTIRLGEALIEKSYGPLTGVPVKYQFIGCERDPDHAGFTFFKFDMNCDGSDIQKVRWKLEEPTKEQPKDDQTSAAAAPGPMTTDKIHIGDPLKARAVEAPAAPDQVQPVPVPQPVEREPVVLQQQPTGSMFDEEDGVSVTTAEGADYLEKNYEKILEDTRTETYRDRDGRTGIRIVSIADQSVANQFGIRRDDVIVKINGTPVSDKSDAVAVVKNELKKRPAVHIIRVTIRRAGREFEKSFDTRDPATRRAAKKGFR